MESKFFFNSNPNKGKQIPKRGVPAWTKTVGFCGGQRLHAIYVFLAYMLIGSPSQDGNLQFTSVNPDSKFTAVNGESTLNSKEIIGKL